MLCLRKKLSANASAQERERGRESERAREKWCKVHIHLPFFVQKQLDKWPKKHVHTARPRMPHTCINVHIVIQTQAVWQFLRGYSQLSNLCSALFTRFPISMDLISEDRRMSDLCHLLQFTISTVLLFYAVFGPWSPGSLQRRYQDILIAT